VQQAPDQALQLNISTKNVIVENEVVLDSAGLAAVKTQQDYMIEPLHTVLKTYAEQARRFATHTEEEFSGKITIQGDIHIPYRILTRVMYTCGQAGYSKVNLLVYRKE
jgi:biopolymer transport protein ExbD